MTLQEVVVVTGLSGAGKTTAVNALEDLGFYSVDNLPIGVLQATLDELRGAGERKVALGLDVRVGAEAIERAGPVLDELRRRSETSLTVLYLDSSEELLVRRFSATRRPHPLSRKGRMTSGALAEGIRLERSLLADLRGRSEVVIDTSNSSVHELRREVIQRFGQDAPGMQLRIVSFGFKFGAPRDADILFDVRFLPNPYFDPKLRDLSGLDAPVVEYVRSHSDTERFIALTMPVLEFCVSRFEAEGKSYATIAIGCTGGRHRSVALAEHIGRELGSGFAGRVEVVHRDVGNAEHAVT